MTFCLVWEGKSPWVVGSPRVFFYKKIQAAPRDRGGLYLIHIIRYSSGFAARPEQQAKHGRAEYRQTGRFRYRRNTDDSRRQSS